MADKIKYRSISIPEGITEEIDRISERYGYRSVAEFVTDSCRRRIEELRQM